jgi:hypothetical protein
MISKTNTPTTAQIAEENERGQPQQSVAPVSEAPSR